MVQQAVNSFSDACPDVAAKIRELLGTDVKFEDSLGYFSTKSKYSQMLNKDSPLEEDRNVINLPIKSNLQAINAINWWTSPCPHFNPLFSRNTNNVHGLCDIVSLAIWGIEDYFIKNIIKKSLEADEQFGRKLYNYWKAISQKRMNDNEDNRKMAWEVAKKAVDNDGLPMSEFHIFLVSNIIRRPIMVLGNSPLCGIYLPLLWSARHACSSPLVIGLTDKLVPLIPSQPELGRDFIPVSHSNGSLLPVKCLQVETENLAKKLMDTYMDIQHHNVLVFGNLRQIPVARLSLISLPYDLSIIDKYFDGITKSEVDVETFLIRDRWGQMALGFPAEDWHLTKQTAIYNYIRDQAFVADLHVTTKDAAVSGSTTGSTFFQRKTVESNDKVKSDAPQKPGLMAKRAAFKRMNTLSDMMGSGFGGRRGAALAGNFEEQSNQNPQPAAMRGPISARPGLGGRVRPISARRGSAAAVPASSKIVEEEEEGPTDEFTKRLKSTYKVVEKPEEGLGFVVDKSAMRAKAKLKKRLSGSDLISPA